MLDDFFEGDGAGGRRSEAAFRQLRAQGHGAWARPGYARAALAEFRRVLGADRVGFSREGFNALAWVSAPLGR
ncbi:MAG: hypothetical protein JSU66_05025 [Deltaproteobacteria bacterium]|nr:MAG: hypothetical protein JSU66_05025 [Deltaproteobacteria bacterium]